MRIGKSCSDDTIFGYRFRDPKLLHRALTHSSLGKDNNQVLEFLGDAVLNMVVSDYLIENFPDASEGELTVRRSQIVNNNNSLCLIAEKLGLRQQIRLDHSFPKSNNRACRRLQSDALEAVIGAMYLDGGINRVKDFLHSQLLPTLEQLDEKSIANHKSILQEYLQSQACALPVYELKAVRGQSHKPQFTVACHVEGLTAAASGEGKSRKEAEQRAALKAYELLRRAAD